MLYTLKGVLEFFVLTLIPTEPMYAKEIINRLQFVGITTQKGTLYPLLNKLKRAHLLETYAEETDFGGIRKYYYLTSAGKARLNGLNQEWRKFGEILHKLRRSPASDRS